MFGRRKSVDAIVSTFTKTVDELRSTAAANEADAARNEEKAAALLTEAQTARAESVRAQAVAIKIENLLN